MIKASTAPYAALLLRLSLGVVDLGWSLLPDKPPPSVVTRVYRFGRAELNPTTRELWVDDRPAPLGARAFDVLHALIERRDRLVSKEELLDLAWLGVVDQAM